MSQKVIVGIVAADIHLSHRPPIARSAEPCWYSAMARPLRQLKKLAEDHKAPVYVAGDIFHTWQSPAELINFALDYLPTCYAIAGQHDLPHHRYDGISKSAYWTLSKVGRIINLPPDRSLEVGHGTVVRVRGFHWDQELEPCRYRHALMVELALVHKYVWTKSTGYVGAPEGNRVGSVLKSLKDYDVCCFGDNHVPFHLKAKDGRPTAVNCGSLMRRNADQVDYSPAVWLLYEDGSVEPHPLDCSEDKFLDATELAKELGGAGLEDFIAELASLGDNAINFTEAVKQYIQRENVGEGVKSVIMKALGEGV